MNRLRSRPALPAQLWPDVRSELDALPDAELLARFADYNDAPAFEALVRRHGPLVYGVCRRVLFGTDPDDAFQAAFLVFVRKARTLHRTAGLGPWLYGVALRVALKARSRAPRAVPLPPGAADMLPDPKPAAEPADWLPILDAELSALPAKYRDALVLCELQGASRTDAAKQLGLREGTLSSRLARGRALLRARLLKHGTLLPASGLAALLGASGTGGASVPAELVARACELGATPAGAVPVGAARLADEVLKAMFLSKLRAAGAALVLALMAVGLAAAALPVGDAPPQPEKPAAKIAPAQPDAKPTAGAKPADRDTVQGLWVLSAYWPVPEPKHTPSDPDKIGKVRLLVNGDVWWMLGTDEHRVRPRHAVLSETKNPKWLDWHNDAKSQRPDFKLIYQLTGDELKLCSTRKNGERPAEFLTEPDVPIEVLTFRRDKAQPGAGTKELLGSWGGASTREAEGGSQVLVADGVRAEVIGDLLFLRSEKEDWFGGRYAVDATKNPRWIDIEPIAPLAGTTKLYGCYEVSDGKWKLAFGHKRATRPLDFAGGEDSFSFELKRPAPAK